MRTAYCPKSHTELASESAGKAYGHVPGQQYHDVDVVVSTRSDKFRVHICESWGSAQGYDEEHGRREAIGRGDSIREAIEDARERAARAGIETEYLEQALSLAEDAAEEKSLATKTISLLDWNNDEPISYLWICAVGCPAGLEFRHDTETDDDEAYCDFSELDLLAKLWDLEGAIDDNGTWCWNGEGDVSDERGNTIYNVKARRN